MRKFIKMWKAVRPMNLLYWSSLYLILFSTFFASSTWAAGLVLYETGTPDVGRANAGRAAIANDASTAGGNPAGMTRLDRSQLMTTIQPLIVRAKFDADAGTTHSGGNGGDAGDTVLSASLSYVHSVSEKLKIGIFSGSYFGLGVDYGNYWAGRYYVQDAELSTIVFNPVVAYRINEWISVGAGFNIIKGNLIQRTAINNIVPFLSDGQIKIEDDDFGYGGNIGILLEPSDGTRFGLTYRSEVEFDFKDVASLRGIGPLLGPLIKLSASRGTDLEMTLPQAIMFSGYHEITDRLAIMGNVGWQEQSEFGKTNVTISTPTVRNFTDDRNFDDTWHFAVGMQYRIAAPWLFSVGFAYDESPVDDADRTPDMPVDRQLRYGTGIQYEWNNDITLGFAYEYLDAGDADIDQFKGPLAGKLVGDYKTNEIHFFAFNINWKF